MTGSSRPSKIEGMNFSEILKNAVERVDGAVSALIIELTLLKPPTLTSSYFFSTIATFILALALCYETAKTWIKGGL